MTARDNNQWLKIDLGREKKITGIATQGIDIIYTMSGGKGRGRDTRSVFV